MDNSLHGAGKLEKYLPFLFFLENNNAQEFEKFVKIANWIQEKRMFSSEELDKCEECIKICYRKLERQKRYPFPVKIYEIFNSPYEEISDFDNDEISNNPTARKRPIDNKSFIIPKKKKLRREDRTLSDGEILTSSDDEVENECNNKANKSTVLTIKSTMSTIDTRALNPNSKCAPIARNISANSFKEVSNTISCRIENGEDNKYRKKSKKRSKSIRSKRHKEKKNRKKSSRVIEAKKSDGSNGPNILELTTVSPNSSLNLCPPNENVEKESFQTKSVNNKTFSTKENHSSCDRYDQMISLSAKPKAIATSSIAISSVEAVRNVEIKKNILKNETAEKENTFPSTSSAFQRTKNPLGGNENMSIMSEAANEDAYLFSRREKKSTGIELNCEKSTYETDSNPNITDDNNMPVKLFYRRYEGEPDNGKQLNKEFLKIINDSRKSNDPRKAKFCGTETKLYQRRENSAQMKVTERSESPLSIREKENPRLYNKAREPEPELNSCRFPSNSGPIDTDDDFPLNSNKAKIAPKLPAPSVESHGDFNLPQVINFFNDTIRKMASNKVCCVSERIISVDSTQQNYSASPKILSVPPPKFEAECETCNKQRVREEEIETEKQTIEFGLFLHTANKHSDSERESKTKNSSEAEKFAMKSNERESAASQISNEMVDSKPESSSKKSSEVGKFATKSKEKESPVFQIATKRVDSKHESSTKKNSDTRKFVTKSKDRYSAASQSSNKRVDSKPESSTKKCSETEKPAKKLKAKDSADPQIAIKRVDSKLESSRNKSSEMEKFATKSKEKYSAASQTSSKRVDSKPESSSKKRSDAEKFIAKSMTKENLELEQKPNTSNFIASNQENKKKITASAINSSNQVTASKSHLNKNNVEINDSDDSICSRRKKRNLCIGGQSKIQKKRRRISSSFSSDEKFTKLKSVSNYLPTKEIRKALNNVIAPSEKNKSPKVARELSSLQCAMKDAPDVITILASAGERKRHSGIVARQKIGKQLHLSLFSELSTSRQEEDDALEMLSASSDTIEFDLEECRKRKEKIQLSSRITIDVKRLPQDEFEKYMHKLQATQCVQTSSSSSSTINLPLPTNKQNFSKKTKSAKRAQSKTKRRILNNNPDMIYGVTIHCVICKKKPRKDLTDHFVNCHKTESYVSRLTAKMLKEISEHKKIAVSVASSAKSPKYKVTCGFCDDEIIDTFKNLYAHYSFHTGEYGFQCDVCKISKPFREDILSHQQHRADCRKGKLRQQYIYDSGMNAINLFACPHCNFVQLNRKNIEKHIEDHHWSCSLGSEGAIQKFLLAAIADAPAINEKLENSSVPITPECLEISEVMDIKQLDNRDEQGNEEAADFLAFMETELSPAVTNETETVQWPKIEATAAFGIPMTVVHVDCINFNSTNSSEKADSPVSSNEKTISTKESTIEMDKTTPTFPSAAEQLPQYDLDNIPSCSGLSLFKDSCAARAQYREYSFNMSYFGLFKCMAIDCAFSTDEEEQMMHHLMDHQASECPPQGYLECSYCCSQSTLDLDPESLIEHITEKHSTSRYQCPKCCYRSCLPGNVQIHRHLCHGEEKLTSDNIVYLCVGRETTVNDKIIYMQNEMMRNVKPLVCPEKFCWEKFYTISFMEEHLIKFHKYQSISLDTKLPQWACIYCGENILSRKSMQEHLAINHPDEYAFACERFLKSGVDKVNDVSNLQLKYINSLVLPENIRAVVVEKNKSLLNARNTETSSIKITESWENSLPQNIGTKIYDEEPCTRSEAFSRNIASQQANFDNKINNGNCADSTQNQAVAIRETSVDDLVSKEQKNLKSLILKLTSNTGISPDVLYRCPVQQCQGIFSTYELWFKHVSLSHHLFMIVCPHCPNKTELHIPEYDTHFKSHCRHTYICFVCGETSVSEAECTVHLFENHENGADDTEYLSEKLNFGSNYSYTVVRKRDEMPYLDVLRHLIDTIQMKLQIAEAQKAIKEMIRWPHQKQQWEDDFPSFYSNPLKICFVKKCRFKTCDTENYFRHLMNTHTACVLRYCVHCELILNQCFDWKQMVDHLRLHFSDLFICCACRWFTPSRANMTTHIRSSHNSREVIVVNLFRNEFRKYISVDIILAERRIALTNQDCFCCKKYISGDMVNHLSSKHNIRLFYACEECSDRLENPKDIFIHHERKHPEVQTFRLRCILKSSSSDLSVSKIDPFTLEASNVKASPRHQLDENHKLYIELEEKRNMESNTSIQDENIQGNCIVISDDDEENTKVRYVSIDANKPRSIEENSKNVNEISSTYQHGSASSFITTNYTGQPQTSDPIETPVNLLIPQQTSSVPVAANKRKQRKTPVKKSVLPAPKRPKKSKKALQTTKAPTPAQCSSAYQPPLSISCDPIEQYCLLRNTPPQITDAYQHNTQILSAAMRTLVSQPKCQTTIAPSSTQRYPINQQSLSMPYDPARQYQYFQNIPSQRLEAHQRNTQIFSTPMRPGRLQPTSHIALPQTSVQHSSTSLSIPNDPPGHSQYFQNIPTQSLVAYQRGTPTSLAPMTPRRSEPTSQATITSTSVEQSSTYPQNLSMQNDPTQQYECLQNKPTQSLAAYQCGTPTPLAPMRPGRSQLTSQSTITSTSVEQSSAYPQNLSMPNDPTQQYECLQNTPTQSLAAYQCGTPTPLAPMRPGRSQPTSQSTITSTSVEHFSAYPQNLSMPNDPTQQYEFLQNTPTQSLAAYQCGTPTLMRPGRSQPTSQSTITSTSVEHSSTYQQPLPTPYDPTGQFQYFQNTPTESLAAHQRGTPIPSVPMRTGGSQTASTGIAPALVQHSLTNQQSLAMSCDPTRQHQSFQNTSGQNWTSLPTSLCVPNLTTQSFAEYQHSTLVSNEQQKTFVNPTTQYICTYQQNTATSFAHMQRTRLQQPFQITTPSYLPARSSEPPILVPRTSFDRNMNSSVWSSALPLNSPTLPIPNSDYSSDINPPTALAIQASITTFSSNYLS